jgi:hypothetical protein
MEQEKNGWKHKEEMWRWKKEMLAAMGEKELHAFITGYMMAEKMVLKSMSSGRGCGCGCGPECSCKGGTCKCSDK